MAEIGLIASVIQVVSTGLALSQTLYQYADSVASADKRIRDIAQDVKLTSFVIDELGRVFKRDETAALISKNAVDTAEETVRECSNVFVEMAATLKKSKKNTLGRLMLPFREPKLELLRTNIERLKSTLQLLMQVLMHAHQIAATKPDKEIVAVQRQQIKALIQTKKESTKRYEESLRSYNISEGSTEVDDDDELGVTTNEKTENTDRGLNIFSTASSMGTTITAKGLESCVEHIQKLLKDIEAVQRVLGANAEGASSTEHEQDLVGSYFRTRSALDSVILGSSSAAKAGLKPGEVILQEKRQFDLVNVEGEREERIRLEQTDSITTVQIEKKTLPIKFKDAKGREFSLPYHICNTWEAISQFVIQIFITVDGIDENVREGRYDLIGPEGEIILPQARGAVIEPGWEITMRMWQTPEQPLRSLEPHGGPLQPVETTDQLVSSVPLRAKEKEKQKKQEKDVSAVSSLGLRRVRDMREPLGLPQDMDLIGSTTLPTRSKYDLVSSSDQELKDGDYRGFQTFVSVSLAICVA
ncbi:hypothetical protein AOQ84DRAFT_92989 [Glonium stellatum]|uniref:Ubiquitin-like domain-containing protein n=1 Tax=Glonium stellatum TaxID=574774 RepID=A0A8E2EVP0_9PEZI|nr:hypothetical protein AOQ84DRAFT_92989 [Glonium stellatum]